MNISIIDDEQEALALLDTFLSKQGHTVTTYSNPLTALSSIRESSDVILLDVIMPQMNGLDLLPKLLEKLPNAKIIIMTSQSTLDKVLNAHRSGAVFYVMKPFNSLQELESKIIEVSK